MKQETLEEAAERLYSDKLYPMYGSIRRDAFINGAEWMQERSYSEEDLRTSFGVGMKFMIDNKLSFEEWFEQFKNK